MRKSLYFESTTSKVLAVEVIFSLYQFSINNKMPIDAKAI